jgi:hypothetical protein
MPSGEPSDAIYLDGLHTLAERFARRTIGGHVPWFVEAKAEQGSFATFLGLEVHQVGPDRGHWRATAVGDCCLFTFLNDTFVDSFPIVDADAFGSHPAALPTQVGGGEELRAAVRRQAGIYAVGDQFLLATDAAAQWLMRALQSDNELAPRLLSALRTTPAALLDMIEAARASHAMRNDDVGLLLVEFESVDPRRTRAKA